ncbi:MAG TPA: hypothetical protein VGB32_02930 [Candidatus Bathyarchaeia archaeon]
MSKEPRINIGPDDPWPNVAMINGVPHHLHYLTTAPTLAVYKKVKNEYPNWDDFLTWNQDFKEALDRCQYYSVQYEAPDGSLL